MGLSHAPRSPPEPPVPDSLPSPEAEAPAPRPSSRAEPVLILLVLALMIGGLIAWAAWPSGADAARRTVQRVGAPAVVRSAGYAGSAACAACHPGEEAQHHRSGHARTLRPIAKTPLPSQLDGRAVADPGRPGVEWAYHKDGDGLKIDRRQGEAVASYDVDWALGSGRNAVTMVSILDRDPGAFRILEHRLTYYRDGDALKLTPGHGADAPPDRALKSYGRTLTPEDSAKCFNCHATRTSRAGPDTPVVLAELTPNVSCERCHGPGRDHVEAARRGAPSDSLRMPAGPGRQTAAEQMAQCGACHHHPDRAFAGEIDVRNPNLVRFQPIGLMQSKCYLGSPGNLSCTACHDAHDRPSTDAAKYEAKCLECHSGPKHVACKVSPKSGCLPCHMPKAPTAQGILFTDHWIRVFSEGADAPKGPRGRFTPGTE